MRSQVFALALVLTLAPRAASAQDDHRLFAGALFGVSTLSADGRSVASGPDLMVSLYKPENGPALNVFIGRHLADYFSLQANWMWNRNDIALVSSVSTPQAGMFYEQHRKSDQQAFVFDTLIYFRPLESMVRPYLGTGLSIVHFSSATIVSTSVQGLAPPGAEIRSTRVGLRSHVGIDLRLSSRVSFRYSFSETISGNPISPSLTPPGERRLANFQNLFGFVARL